MRGLIGEDTIGSSHRDSVTVVAQAFRGAMSGGGLESTSGAPVPPHLPGSYSLSAADSDYIVGLFEDLARPLEVRSVDAFLAQARASVSPALGWEAAALCVRLVWGEGE